MQQINSLLNDSELYVKWINHNNESIRRSLSDLDKENFDCYDDRKYDVFLKNEYDHAINTLKTNVETLENLVKRYERPTIETMERLNKLKQFINAPAPSTQATNVTNT